MQIQTGHLPVNDYLERIGKINTKDYNECNTDNPEDTVVKTINHFLFECLAHHNFR